MIYITFAYHCCVAALYVRSLFSVSSLRAKHYDFFLFTATAFEVYIICKHSGRGPTNVARIFNSERDERAREGSAAVPTDRQADETSRPPRFAVAQEYALISHPWYYECHCTNFYGHCKMFLSKIGCHSLLNQCSMLIPSIKSIYVIYHYSPPIILKERTLQRCRSLDFRGWVGV